MSRVRKFLAPVVALLILLAGARLSLAQSTLGIMVSDQPIVDGTVTVNRVVSSGPAWVVIHQDDHGRPGAAIGHARILGGESANVKAQIDVQQATETVYAALYTDSGRVGSYEFLGSDALVQVDGKPIVSSFRVTGGLPETLPEAGGAPVPWAGMLMMAGLLLLTASMVLNQARRAHRAHAGISN